MAERYRVGHRLGRGAFGEVTYGTDLETGKPVALKSVRLRNVRDGIPPAAFRELRALRELNHPSIVQLIDVHAAANNMVLVFEHMESDLYKVIDGLRSPLSESVIRGYMLQLLQGLQYCHQQRIMHRDIKPSNLLIGANGELKIADFGLARVLTGQENQRYSHQVATRWYRAPELLFGAQIYTEAVDMWAVGCVLAELLNHAPLFPGEHDIDQVYRVAQVLGTPCEELWPGVSELPDFNKLSFVEMAPISLRSLFPDASDEAKSLIEQLLVYQPAERLTAAQALQHPFFFSGDAEMGYRAQGPAAEQKYGVKDLDFMDRSTFTANFDD